MFRPNIAIPTRQNIAHLVRILHPLSAWIGARRGDAKPQCFGDSRDSKNDSIFGARREIRRRDPPCTELHGRYRTPKQLARHAKNLGEIRVLQHGLQKANGEDRNRTFRCFPNVSFEFER
jgi:hypothetical protein